VASSKKDSVERSMFSWMDYGIEVTEFGRGPPLLYLHGAGGTGPLMDGEKPAAFLERLASRFRVIMPEHPGFGDAERPVWLRSIHDMAYFYLDFLGQRNLTNVHIAGSSLGGWIALEMAVRSTARLASLSISGAAGIRLEGVPRADIFLWSREDFIRNCIVDAAKRDRVLAALSADITPEQQARVLRAWETTALLGWNPRMHDPQLKYWLHRIDVPTHVVWADQDQVAPLAYGEAFARMIPGAKLTVVADAGHLTHIDQPTRFADAVMNFAEGVAA